MKGMYECNSPVNDLVQAVFGGNGGGTWILFGFQNLIKLSCFKTTLVLRLLQLVSIRFKGTLLRINLLKFDSVFAPKSSL